MKFGIKSRKKTLLCLHKLKPQVENALCLHQHVAELENCFQYSIFCGKFEGIKIILQLDLPYSEANICKQNTIPTCDYQLLMFQSKPLMNLQIFAIVHSLMNDMNLIDSWQAHLPLTNAL